MKTVDKYSMTYGKQYPLYYKTDRDFLLGIQCETANEIKKKPDSYYTCLVKIFKRNFFRK